MESKMKATKTVAVTKVVSKPAGAVWEIIRTGRDVNRILPAVVESCRVEGAGAGARRYCGTKQGVLEETILCVDDATRLFRYRIDKQSMMPLEGYEGSVHVSDLGSRGSEILWFATYYLLDEQADQPVRDGLAGMFQMAIDGIGGLVSA